jgi:hypothetical protein
MAQQMVVNAKKREQATLAIADLNRMVTSVAEILDITRHMNRNFEMRRVTGEYSGKEYADQMIWLNKNFREGIKEVLREKQTDV